MNKSTRIYNLHQGQSALEILVALDFQVHQFSEYHFRIGGRLDVWPSSRKFYDIKSHQKGVYDNLERFVQKHFRQHPLFQSQITNTP